MKFILLLLAALQLISAKINVCRKRNYDRGVGKIRWRCREGESRRAGLCYTNCKDGYGELVTRCIMQCKDQYPVKCGLEFCAATKGDCAKVVAAITGGTIGLVAAFGAGGAIVGGAAGLAATGTGTGMFLGGTAGLYGAAGAGAGYGTAGGIRSDSRDNCPCFLLFTFEIIAPSGQAVPKPNKYTPQCQKTNNYKYRQAGQY